MNSSPSIADWNRLLNELIATQIEFDRIKKLLIKTDEPAGILAGQSVTLNGAFVQGSPTLGAIGLANVQDAVGSINLIAIRQGPLILTTTQWDTVTGDTGGLTPNTLYYVSLTGITKTRPVSGNVYAIGSAVSSTQLNILFQAHP